MRGLTLVVAETGRLRTALELAAAQAALGGRARLFCQGAAAAALQSPMIDAGDAAQAAAGLPTLAGLFDDALALGVEAIACQTGLAITATPATALDPRVSFGGLVGLLQTLGDDRLLIA